MYIINHYIISISDYGEDAMQNNEKYENDISNSGGLSKGLFGETDRSSGEYHFRSGYTQRVYSNAHYVPVDESAAPPKYYKPIENNSTTEAAKRKRTGLGFFAVLALCLSCALLGGIIGAGFVSSRLESRISSLEQNTLPIEENIEEITAEENGDVIIASASGSEILRDISQADVYSASDIYSIACEEAVCINVETVYRDRSGYEIPSVTSGSGFVITEDGYILTNYHVVQKAAENGFPVSVAFYNGVEYSGDVISCDKSNDIALVKISATDLKAVTMGDSSSAKVGDEVFAIGNPFQILEFTMTSGHISALNRLIATDESNNAIEMFQIDAAVYEGNSGGPLYNNQGEVIAIVSAKYSEGTNYEGIGLQSQSTRQNQFWQISWKLTTQKKKHLSELNSMKDTARCSADIMICPSAHSYTTSILTAAQKERGSAQGI